MICGSSNASKKLSSDRGSWPAGSGKLELTAKGIRKLAERALVKVFEMLKHDRPGGHEDQSPGGLAEPTGATRPWQLRATTERYRFSARSSTR